MALQTHSTGCVHTTTSQGIGLSRSKSLDARMKELTAQGLGVERKSAEPITQDMEAILWEKGIFSVESCKGLLNVVYFYNCKFFGLRSGDEHRSLDVEQFRFCVSDGIDYVEYIGRTSKTLLSEACQWIICSFHKTSHREKCT